MGGMAKRAPVLAILFVIVTMALLAMPGSANFVGEFFILKGVFETKVAIALIASIGIALAAFYSLRMYQRTMHNRLPEGTESREITLREAVVHRPARRLHRRPRPLPRPDHDAQRGLGRSQPGALCEGSYAVQGARTSGGASCPKAGPDTRRWRVAGHDRYARTSTTPRSRRSSPSSPGSASSCSPA